MNSTTRPHPPVQKIKLPVDNLSDIAIVSWRWDSKDGIWGSRNIFHVIRQARRIGIRYLLIDCISVNQSLSENELLTEVVAFSTLYKTIPVIAAYDTVDDFGRLTPLHFRYTLSRPWIFNELRTIRYNPKRVLYVGHNHQGTRLSRNGGNQPLGEASNYLFGYELPKIWRGGFTNVILSVLCGKVGMTSISDFKFIIPTFARILNLAHDKMTQNDYLLTAAILCQTHRIDRDINNRYLNDIRDVEFQRYTFCDARGTSIHLIFTALGLTDSDFQEYLTHEEIRLASLFINDNVPLPRVEILPND
ncbi:hypothetical protein IWW34DRAFT_812046 [Fusarium oxysporum f. sp. albedinis]|nr:hypothetical protein IWW34DRAFT_812046 [Fusarium oxysporum f. sp. albedinis]